MKVWLLTGVLLIAGALMVWTVWPNERTIMEEKIVTPNTDLAGLREITAIPGAPKALWARIPMGKIDQTGRLPGPTDLILMAVLDYGNSGAVEDVLGDAEGSKGSLDFAKEPVRHNWYPDEILATLSDGKIPVIDYGPIDAFGGQRVSVFEGTPHILLLRKPLF